MCARHAVGPLDGLSAHTQTAFDHVGLSVADLDGQVAFYSRALELEEEFRFEIPEVGMSAVILRSPDGWGLELLHRPDSLASTPRHSPPDAVLDRGYGHLCLRFQTGLEDAYTRFIEAGGSEIVTPRPGPHPAVMFSYAADPEGHLVEMIQYLPGFDS